MTNSKSLQQQVDELQHLNETLTKELKCSFDIAHELRIEAFHNEIVGTLINERFLLSQSDSDAIPQQTRFLRTFANVCQSDIICIYRLESANDCFRLESSFSRDDIQPLDQFPISEAIYQDSDVADNTPNFTFGPQQSSNPHIKNHWLYDKVTQRAILVSLDKAQQDFYDCLTPKVLRTALQLYEDIQIKQDYEQQLIHRATIDPMTKLPNRNLAFDLLAKAMSDHSDPNQLICALFVDIAHFKDINEAFGHDIGDKILAIIAKRIHSAIRESDFVARLSGDEFLVVLKNISKPQSAEIVARNIISAISDPLRLQGRELLIASNIGISSYPDDGNDASVLIQNADMAMYQSRKLGLNQYQFYTAAINDEVAQRLSIETGLQKALANNEFYLHYQPLVEISTGQTVTVEALIRWHSPTLGHMSPASFIAIAEEDGFIIPIGFWVIEEVCRQLKIWHREGIENLTVAINISVRQLQDKNFVERLMTILKRNNIPTNKIELEITEGILISDVAGADGVLTVLHALGFKLSLDDFGTGYSALSYLNNYHFDYLKIDRSFITNLINNEKDKALVNAIVAMAHQLNLKVIAEGVEHEAELEYLKSQKCDYIQGFYYSRPVPGAQISRGFFESLINPNASIA